MVIADRSTLATDTVMASGFYNGSQWPLLHWDTKDSSFVYNVDSGQTLTSVAHSQFRIKEIKGGRFLLSEGRDKGTYSLTFYLKFIDSSMRVNENLQRYFRNYLDDEMDINK